MWEAYRIGVCAGGGLAAGGADVVAAQAQRREAAQPMLARQSDHRRVVDAVVPQFQRFQIAEDLKKMQ